MSRAMASDRLQAIRDADAAAGENLQCCPSAWQDRRDLLVAHDAAEEVLEDHDRLVRELDVIINGDGAAPQAKLCDIVAQIRTVVVPITLSIPAGAGVPSTLAPPAVPMSVDGYDSEVEAPAWKCLNGVLHLIGNPCDCRSEGCSMSL